MNDRVVNSEEEIVVESITALLSNFTFHIGNSC